MSEDDPCGGESALYSYTDGGEVESKTNYLLALF